MASSSGAYLTYDAHGKQNREDLLDIITNLSPIDTPLYSRLSTGPKATNVFHEFLSYETDRATDSGASVEGEDNSYADLTSPTRNINFVQTITKTYKISYEQEATDTAGGNTRAFQRLEKMRQWKLAFEYSLIFGSGTSGSSNTAARQMKGILLALAKATNASEASMSETRFNDYLNEIWNDTADSTIAAYMDMRIKRHITSQYTTTNVRNVEAGDKILINAVDVYQSDAAQNVELYPHRDLAGTNRLFFIQPRAFRKSFMMNPKDMDTTTHQQNAYTGKIVGSGTLEYLFPKAGLSVANVG